MGRCYRLETVEKKHLSINAPWLVMKYFDQINFPTSKIEDKHFIKNRDDCKAVIQLPSIMDGYHNVILGPSCREESPTYQSIVETMLNYRLISKHHGKRRILDVDVLGK